MSPFFHGYLVALVPLGNKIAGSGIAACEEFSS
jgi:hypothetical protein